MNIIEITTIEQLQAICAQEQTALIFKHSSRCFISKMVRQNFEQALKSKGIAEYFLINVIQNRDVSAAATDQFNIRHESPQLLIVQHGKLIGSASHEGILSFMDNYFSSL